MTWEVPPGVHGPLGWGVKAVVVTRCQIKHDLVEFRSGVLLGNLLLSQEAPHTVSDSFDLLHHALLKGSKVKDLAINRAHLNRRKKIMRKVRKGKEKEKKEKEKNEIERKGKEKDVQS